MTELFIKQPQLFGHPEVPEFETQCRYHANAFTLIYPLKPNIRHWLKVNKQYTSDSRLDGATNSYFEFLVAYETDKLKQRDANAPIDFFGMSKAMDSGEQQSDGYIGTQEAATA